MYLSCPCVYVVQILLLECGKFLYVGPRIDDSNDRPNEKGTPQNHDRLTTTSDGLGKSGKNDPNVTRTTVLEDLLLLGLTDPPLNEEGSTPLLEETSTTPAGRDLPLLDLHAPFLLEAPLRDPEDAPC